jgi:peptide-methionine (R)-S-oxide reductase
MMTRRTLFGGAVAGFGAFIATRFAAAPAARAAETFEVMHSDAEWKKMLSSDQYYILREAGTERPFSSPLDTEKRKGTFACAGCELPLFSSDTKFDSGTGWPSFWTPMKGAVNEVTDGSFGIERTAVECHRCGGHLGHVFNDGPQPTGLRYCMNGLAMTFKPVAA